MNYGYEILDEETLEPVSPIFEPEQPAYDILDEETLQPIEESFFPTIPTPQKAEKPAPTKIESAISELQNRLTEVEETKFLKEQDLSRLERTPSKWGLQVQEARKTNLQIEITEREKQKKSLQIELDNLKKQSQRPATIPSEYTAPDYMQGMYPEMTEPEKVDPNLPPFFQKEKDPNKRAEALSIISKKERVRLIKMLPEDEQKKVSELVEMIKRRVPILGPTTMLAGAATKAAGGTFDIESPYESEAGKHYQEIFERHGFTVDQFRDEEGKIDAGKIAELPSTRDKIEDENRRNAAATFLGMLGSYEQRKPAFEKVEKKVKEAGEHVLEFGAYMTSSEIRTNKIEERINKLRDERGNEYAEALERGDLGVVIDQLINDEAVLKGDKESAKKALQLRKDYHRAIAFREATKDPEKEKGMFKKLILSTLEILAPMVKIGAKAAVPYVGQTWAFSEWASQGSGMLYAELDEAGVSHETARTLSPLAGMAYAGAEMMQFGQITKGLTKGLTKGVVDRSVKKVALRILKEKGKDYFKEVSEEIVQEFIIETGKEIGKQTEGLAPRGAEEFGRFLWDASQKSLKAGGYAAGPMGLLSVFGIGGATVGAMYEGGIEKREKQNIEFVKQMGKIYDIIEEEKKDITEEPTLDEAFETRKHIVENLLPQKIGDAEFYKAGEQPNFRVAYREKVQQKNIKTGEMYEAVYDYYFPLSGYDLTGKTDAEIKNVIEETIKANGLQGEIVYKEPGYDIIEPVEPVKLSRQQKKKSDKFTQAIQTYESREEGDNLIIDWATNKLNAGDVIQVDQGEMTWTVSEKTISKHGTEYIEFKSGEATQNDFGITKRKDEDWKIINKDDARAAFTFDNRPEYAADNPLLVPIKEEIKLAPEEEKSVIKTFESVYKNEGLSPEEATARAEESLKDLPNESKKLFTKISAERDKLKKQLYIDNLTGLKSRDWGVDNGYFTVKKVKGKDIYTPADKPQVMIDIDNFKKSVNDKYGHPVGDDVLTTLGRMLNEEFEGKAESVRFGGEEILTFPLTGFDKDDIIKRLERVRSELRNESFADGKLTGVSFSAGFGNTNKEADEALYAAKEAGKNQTHEYGVKYEEPAKPDTEGVGRVRKAEVADVTPPVSKAKEEPGEAKAPEKVVPAKEEPEELKEPEKITGKSEAAGQEVQVEPSEAQKEAGNYKKAHIRRDGFDISIENPAGTERSGKDKSGKEWTQKMYADYGYIKGSVGYDKDHVDVFIKPDSPEGGTVYIVNQVDPQSKKFDEHKAMVGYDSEEAAKKGYLQNYEKGWQGLGSIVPMEMEVFKEWAMSKEPKKGTVKEKPAEKEKPDVSRVGDVVEPVEPGEPGVREGAKAEEPTGPEVERERKAVKPEGVKPDKERIEGGRGTGDRVSGLLSSGDTGGGAGRRGDEQANVRGVVDKGKPLLIDYLIDNVDNIGHGGAVTKTRDNLSAIKILKQIESENRYATPDEQQQLVRYVGWGGLSSAFKKSDRFYNELKDLLTEEEYNAARRSTLNAHYTSPTVIQSMWNGLVRMGYNGGNVLEPAIGIGHFFGLRPTTLKMAMSGIELDPISGRIARQLYQNADIRVQGYETFKMPKDYYQAIVSNVPFSDSKPVEPNEIKTPGLKEKVSLHDFYFLKSLYGLRPGGIIAFVTSRYTMDKKDSSIRKEITKQGDFIGAVRLPTTAFKENAGTEVVTDIIFIQKRAEDKPESDLNKLFVDTSPVMMQRVKGEGQKEEFVNKYYQENPDMVIGDQDLSGTMYTGDQYNVVLKPDISKEGFSDMLNDAVNSLPQNIISDYIVSEEKAKPQEDMDNLGDIHQLPTGSYFTRHGNVYQKASETDKPIKISGKNKEKLLFLTKIKENAQMLFASQRAGDTKTAKESLAKLNIVYDKFYKKYGAINEKKNDVFKDDPAVFLLYSLEKYDNEKKTAEKTALFKGVTFAKETPVEQTDSIEEALIVSLNLFGVVDVGHIAKMMDKDPVEIGDILVSDGLAFRSPEEFLNGKRNIYVTRDEYLSGNVRKKLEKSRQVAKKDPAFNYNVNELEAVIPADIPSERISIKINSPVIESTDIKDFIKESLDGYNISAIHNDFNGQWSVDFKTYGFGIMERDFGTPRMNAKKIMQNMMNGKKPKVYDVSRDMEGNETKTLNETETAAAQVKAELLAKKFREWLWSDDDRKSRIVRTFNDRFNSFINRTYTHPKRIKNKDAKIFFPGSAFPHPAHPHQADAVWRIVQSKRTMLAHEVGSGKTLEMIWGGMEAKRLGLIKKPIYTFPNHMVKQWAKEFYEAYPNAKLLVAQEKDLSKEKRRVFINKIATGDWDAVLVKMEDFKSIPLSPTEEANQMQHFVSTYRGYIDSLDKDAKKQRTIKQLEKKLQNFEDKIAILKNKAKKEKGVLYFEDLGIDMLFVDEADLYKNLQYYTSLENVKGMGTQQGSGRAFNMFMKIQYLNRKNGRIIFATGTPISNTLVEAYTMMKFLQLEWLHDEGIESFDDWNRMFADTVTEMELDNTGSSYRPTTRFSKITNVPSLMKALREVWDIQTAARLEKEKILVAGRDLPHKKVINRATPLTDLMKSFKRYLVRREDSLKGARPEKGADNVLVIMDDGRKAAIDFRLFSPKLPDLPESKLNLVVNDTYEHYKKYDKQKYTQIIFIERPRAYRVDSDGKRHLTFDAVEDIKKKLIAKGIPENEIAWISDKKYEKDAAKAALFGAVRDGRVRVLIGSVAKMGAGTNVQDLGKAVRQVDAKYRPRDFTQSNGRFVRQGNKVLDFDEKGNVTTPKGEMGTVEIYNYTAKGSLDTGLWNMLEVKSRAINNIMENTESLDYEIEEEYFSSIKDLSIEDPVMKEAVTLRQRIKELTNFERAYIDNRARLRSAIKAIPGRIENIKKNVAKYEKDIAKREPQLKGEDFSITIDGKKYDKRKDAGEILIKLLKPLVEKTGATGKEQKQSNVGTFAGFPISIRTYIVRSFHDEKVVSEVFATGNFQYIGQFDPITKSPSGLIGSLNNTIYIRMDKSLESEKSRIRAEEKSLADAQASVDDKFEYEQELEEKKKRVAEVDKTLSERKEVTVAAEDEPVQWEDIRGYIPTVDTGKEEEEGRIEDVEEDEGEPEEPTLKAKFEPLPFKKDISEVMGMVSEDLKRNVDIVFARNYDKGKYSLKQGERGAIERVGDRIRVTINPALTSKEAARTLVHEVMGHFGVANVLRSNPDIHKRLIAIYNTQKNSPLIKKIRKEYVREMKDNPKFAEDMVFSEWIAYSMEEYIANPKGKGVSYYVWRAIKQFLIKMGWREDTVENVMHDIVKELKTVRFVGPTYVAKVPVLKAKDYIPVVSYREEMLDDIYDSVSGEKKGLFRRIFKHEKSYQKIKDRIAADILVPISTRLKHIKPIFKEQIRRFEFNYHKKEYVDTKASQPFLNGVKKMEAKDQQILDYALKNTDTAMVLKIVTKYNLEKEFGAVRKVLDGIHENMRDVGFKINYVKDYWPRQVLNYSGLLKEVQDTEEWGIIEEQISKAEEKLKRPLSEKEKAEIVNFFIARPDRIIDMPGGAKKRTIDLIDEKIDKYYDYSMSALIQYIHNMNQSIEIRRFLGMDKDVKAEKEKIQKVLSVEEFKVVATEIVNNRVVDIEGGIGEYVMRAISEHNLTPQQQDELIGILKARFNYRPSGHTTQTIKDIGYITSMGSGFSSFITQIGDLTWAYYVAGPIKATKALARAFVGMSEVRKEHIGIERIAEEFRTSRGLGRILNKIFDWTLLTKVDAIGKEALINGVLYKYQQQAKKNDIKLTRLLQRTFGFEEGAEVMEDFKNKNITDNVKYLLFTKLLDFQPLALSEMPMKYLKSPGGRLFYMLKTFTIKQLDAFRNESIDYIKEGISAKNGKLILKGLINMAHLAALFVAANTGADELKDWLFGRKPSFSDKVWDNIFRLFGLSRYISWEVRRNGIVMAFWKLITPPMDIIEAPLRDSWKMFKENGESFDVKLKNAETWKIIPFFGKHYYWWFGGGRRREVKRQQKSIPKLNFARILKKETTTLEEKMTAYKYYLDLTPEQHKDFAKEIPGYTKQIRKIKKGLLGQSVWKEGEKRFVKMGGAVKNFKKREENLKERLKKGKISQADYNKTTKKIDKEREEYLEWKEQLHE